MILENITQNDLIQKFNERNNSNVLINDAIIDYPFNIPIDKRFDSIKFVNCLIKEKITYHKVNCSYFEFNNCEVKGEVDFNQTYKFTLDVSNSIFNNEVIVNSNGCVSKIYIGGCRFSKKVNINSDQKEGEIEIFNNPAKESLFEDDLRFHLQYYPKFEDHFQAMS